MAIAMSRWEDDHEYSPRIGDKARAEKISLHKAKKELLDIGKSVFHLPRYPDEVASRLERVRVHARASHRVSTRLVFMPPDNLIGKYTVGSAPLDIGGSVLMLC